MPRPILPWIMLFGEKIQPTGPTADTTTITADDTNITADSF